LKGRLIMGQWHRAIAGEVCQGCGDTLEEGQDAFTFDKENLCEGCYEDAQDCSIDFDDYSDQDYDLDFADPGGNSALRAATPNNPRNQPCPTCGDENVLTPADVALHYQCNRCADQAEGG
jgi:hypothetical protein